MFGAKTRKIEYQQQALEGLHAQITDLRADKQRLNDALTAMRIQRTEHSTHSSRFAMERDAAQAELQKQRLLHKARMHELEALKWAANGREDKMVGSPSPAPTDMSSMIADIARACGPGVTTHMGKPHHWVAQAIRDAKAEGQKEAKDHLDKELKVNADKWLKLEEMLTDRMREVANDDDY